MLCPAWAQITIHPGTQLRTAGNIKLVLDNLSVSNNSPQADLSASSIIVRGNNNVQLGGSQHWQVNSLIIDKTSSPVQLGSAFTIANTVQLVQGQLNLNGRNITLLPTATVEGENENNRIIGPNGGEVSITLPLQSPAGVNPGKLGIIISSTQNLGNVTIRRGHIQRIPVNAGSSILRYYQVIPANNQNLNATLRFHYLDAELNNLAENNLQLFTTDNGNLWRLEGPATKSTTQNYVERSGVQTLQSYTLSPSASLPLLWGKTQTHCKDNGIVIEWETQQELHTAGFTVQRSQDGLHWSDIATIQAKGNTTSHTFYSYSDASAPSGKLLYRIQATDHDGSKHFSSVTTAQGCADAFTMKLWPVPARSKTTLSIFATRTSTAVITLTGSDGKVLQQFTLALDNGSNQLELFTENLPAGNYFVRVHLESSVRTIPFSKQ